MKRVFLIVLDGFGVGEASDAVHFCDVGSNTFKSVCQSKNLNIPHLLKMGLGNLGDFSQPEADPIASYGTLGEVSMGKDTTTGHWEMAGIVSEKPFPTYPEGFPADMVSRLSTAIGRGVLLNKPSSGITAIEEYGDKHVESGDIILYTSVDSVLQIAAHEEIIPLEELYKICETARKIFTGEHGVGRVIARPFTGTSGNYKRTANRRDFSLKPPYETALDAIKRDKEVIGIGKISDIFAGAGISRSYLTHSNLEGIEKTLQIMDEDFEGLCFVNLVDTDMLFGHRRDISGYAAALNEFDLHLPKMMAKMDDGDALIITGDHGCDPGFTKTTDHTREDVPIIIYSPSLKSVNLGKTYNFGNIGKTVCDMLNVRYTTTLEGFYGKLIKKGI